MTRMTELIASAARELDAEFDVWGNEWDFECSCGAIISIGASTGIVVQHKGGPCRSRGWVTEFVNTKVRAGSARSVSNEIDPHKQGDNR
jgi:hypothetical protein